MKNAGIISAPLMVAIIPQTQSVRRTARRPLTVPVQMNHTGTALNTGTIIPQKIPVPMHVNTGNAPLILKNIHLPLPARLPARKVITAHVPMIPTGHAVMIIVHTQRSLHVHLHVYIMNAVIQVESTMGTHMIPLPPVRQIALIR